MKSLIFLFALSGVICAVPLMPTQSVVRTNDELVQKYMLNLTDCFRTVESGEEMTVLQQESCMASVGATRMITAARSIMGVPASNSTLIDQCAL